MGGRCSLKSRFTFVHLWLLLFNSTKTFDHLTPVCIFENQRVGCPIRLGSGHVLFMSERWMKGEIKVDQLSVWGGEEGAKPKSDLPLSIYWSISVPSLTYSHKLWKSRTLTVTAAKHQIITIHPPSLGLYHHHVPVQSSELMLSHKEAVLHANIKHRVTCSVTLAWFTHDNFFWLRNQ